MLFVSNENNFTRFLFKIVRSVLAFRTESNFDISRNPYPGFRQVNKCINVSACTDHIPDTLLVF